MGNLKFFTSSSGDSSSGNCSGGDGVAKLEILSGKVNCEQNGTTYSTILLPFEKYELRALHIVNRTNENPIVVRLAEVEEKEAARYVSLSRNVIEDILNYPLIDLKGTGCLHMWIDNNYEENCEVQYEMRITNLL